MDLDDGHDPSALRKVQVDANIEAARITFELMALEWHARSAPTWTAVHAEDIMRSLVRDVLPEIGSQPVSLLTPKLVFDVLKAIEDRGAIETAKRVRQRISAVCIYAIAKGFMESDPAEKLGVALKPMRRGRQPAITDIDELRAMIVKAEEDYARPITRLALRMLALTVARSGELHGARWDEFEGLNGLAPLWRIPAALMKGDRDRKEEIDGDHLVPLTAQAVAVMRALWPLTGAVR